MGMPPFPHPAKFITVILLTAVLFAGCSARGAPLPAATASFEATATPPRPSKTSTIVTLPTATIIRTAAPPSVASPVYYMFVLDASENMKMSFDGKTSWEAAREAADTILEGLEPGANYGLVVIGG